MSAIYFFVCPGVMPRSDCPLETKCHLQEVVKIRFICLLIISLLYKCNLANTLRQVPECKLMTSINHYPGVDPPL